MNVALEVIGDRWTLLILRDLLFKQYTMFRQFHESGEGIATNILSDRLKKLQEHGIIEGRRSVEDARVVEYRPTTKGLDLLPVLIEMIVWAARYEQTAAPSKLLRQMSGDRDGFIGEIRSRFSDTSEV